MAVLKKNQVNQILFTMVDKTDFATIEASLASNFTVKRFGVDHGSAAANVSTLSRAVSKVGSGIYRLSLEANACNYDYVALRIAHASAATQMLVFEMRTYDDTDQYSLLSDVNSNFASRIPKEVANASQLLLMKSQLSDTYSLVSDFYSDFGSRVPKELASKSLLSDVNSNLLSYLAGMSNILSAVYVDTADISNVVSNIHADLADLSGVVSDFVSDFGSRVPKEVISKSLMSDYHSDLKSAIGNVSVTLGASDVSDIASAVAAAITTLGPSDISDIASAVWAYGTKEVSLDASTMSDIRSVVLSLSDAISNAYSAATVGASRALLNQSSISDLYSLLSDFYSDFGSRVPKEVASKSLLSDVNSNLLSYLGGMSDVLSNVHGDLADLSGIVSDFYSDFQSRVPKELASKSLLSDINSNLLSYLGGMSDVISNAYSAAVVGASRALLNQSMLSDIDSALTSQYSDVKSAAAAIKAKTDNLQFTVGSMVDANLHYINDVSLIGDGGATPWGP